MRTLLIGRARYSLAYEYRPPGALKTAMLIRRPSGADACLINTAFLTAELAYTSGAESHRVLLALSADCGDDKRERVVREIGETETVTVTETEVRRVAGGMRVPCLIITDLVDGDRLVGVYRRDGINR